MRIHAVTGLAALIFAFSNGRAADNPPAPQLELETIVVKSQKLEVENLIDRKVYSISSDAQSSFGTLSDILSVIPSVDVDPDGIVSLRGDTKVLVLIDGKPSSQFAGAAAGDNLQTLSAADIERIEILTTPPAEFKADGAAGVINIITRKKHPNGTAGTLQGSAGSGGRYVLGANGSYRAGALTASLNVGYRQDYRERRVESTVVAADAASGGVLSSGNAINERIRREVPTVKAAIEYVLNDRQTLSAAASWTDRGGLRTYTQVDNGTTSGQGIVSSTRRFSSGHDPEIDYDERLAFLQVLADPGESLDFSLHRSSSHQDERYDYINDSFIPPLVRFYNNLEFVEDHATTDFDADYVWPIPAKGTLKLGYAFELEHYRFTNAGNNIDPLTGEPVADPTLNNHFKFDQTIHAIYATYQMSISAWTWLAGLRAEQTDYQAVQVLNLVASRKGYFQLYPSIHVERSLNEQSSWSFGASRRVVRPDPSDLNPYVDHEYAPNLNAGNFDLKPQYSQSYETGYQYQHGGQSYGVTGYYRLNHDSATTVTDYLANGVTLTTKDNLPKDKSAGLEFSANGRILPQLTYGISGNVFYSQIDASSLGVAGLQSNVGLNAKVRLDYRPTDANAAQITVTRSDKRLTPQGYVGAINVVNLGYKYQVTPALKAVATLSDLFDGQRLHRFFSSPTLAENYERRVLGRVLYIGVVYSFGFAGKDKQPAFEYDQSN